MPDNGPELDAAALLLMQHLVSNIALAAKQLLQMGVQEVLKGQRCSQHCSISHQPASLAFVQGC